MRRRSPSIRQTLMLITGALTLMITALAAKDMYGNWVRLRDIETLEDATGLSDRLFDATERLSVERDVALAMLRAPDFETVDDLRPRLVDSRKGTDQAVRASVTGMDHFGFQELSDLRAKILANLLLIEVLRPAIEDASDLPREARDRELIGRWSGAVTALMQETDDLRISFIRHFIDIDPVVTQHIWFKRFLRTITDYAGRERSLIGQLIAQNADPTPQNIVELQRGQGIVELSWQMSRTLADQSGLYASIAPYYTDASSHYSTMHDMIQNLFYVVQARRGGSYPISADLWFELSTQASDSLTALRDATIRTASAYVDGLIMEAQRAIFGAGIVFALGLILCAYSFWTVVRRVIQPINRMVDVLLKATRGEKVAFIAPVGGQDEIGKLAVVLHAFQQAADEVKRTSMELTRSQTHLRAVVDYAVDGLFTINSEGVIESFNPACERLFGFGANEMIGRSITTLMADSGRWETEAYLPREMDVSKAAVGPGTRELSARRKDGATFPIELSLSTFTLDDGRHFSAIVRDITLRKEAEEALARHTRALELSNKELDDFAYIASYDLKKPLRGIHNHSRFLLEDNEDKLDKDSVGRLHRLTSLSKRMEKLVNDLLYFSRLGRQELAVQATDLNAVVHDIEATLDVFLAERSASISIPRELPIIICDKTRVAELFRNLITNGIKYNDKPKKIIEIGHLLGRKTPDGAHAKNVFYVKDNGRGIPAEFHEEIFRIFKRLQNEQDTEEGTGVGLTFVRKIIERHNGKIWLESEPGLGTTFYFTLEEQRHDAGYDSAEAA